MSLVLSSSWDKGAKVIPARRHRRHLQPPSGPLPALRGVREVLASVTQQSATAKCRAGAAPAPQRGSSRRRRPLAAATAPGGDFSPLRVARGGLLCVPTARGTEPQVQEGLKPGEDAPLSAAVGTYRRAGVLRGVCREWGRLAGRGRAGAGPMASLHRHVEELELEEPCEERAVVLQLPGEEEARREPSR